MAEPHRAPASTEQRPRRTGFGATLLVGFSGAALATAAATRGWAEATTVVTGERTVVARGADVAPLVLPLALVALAGWGTVLVLREVGRRVVSLLGVAASAAAGVVALLRADDAPAVAVELLGEAASAVSSSSVWPFLAAAGCVLSAGAFVVTFWRAPAWPEMSPRYDAPGDRRSQEASTDMWKALDAGEDPTT